MGAQVEERRERARLDGPAGAVDFEQRLLVAGDEGGRPLLLAHGIAGSADEWLGVMPALAERFRVVAPDAPGHGFSEKPVELAYDLAMYVASARQTIEALGRGRPVPLVALSGAGTVAIAIALSAPHLLSHLVLVDAAGIGEEVSWDYRFSSLPGGAQLFRRMLSPAAIRRYGRRLVYHGDRLPAGWVDRRMRIWATPNAVDAFFRTARQTLSLGGQRVTFGGRLREITHPTLILWGEQDAIIPLAHAHRAASRIPRAALRTFPHCGHVPPWEYPDEFVKTVVRFLGEPG